MVPHCGRVFATDRIIRRFDSRSLFQPQHPLPPVQPAQIVDFASLKGPAEGVEDLAPTLSPDTPNPEYPWPRANPHTAPAEHTFAIWEELQETASGRKFLSLVRDLFAAAEAFL